MKCCLTGHTKGLGKVLYNHFESLGWEVIGFNRTTGLDSVVSIANGCDLFINNAYADGIQINFLNQLYNSVGKMIVCGSVASDFPDPELPVYSQHKLELEQRFLEVADYAQADMLLLKLSSDAYNNPTLILKVVDLWLKNPTISVVNFKAKGNPNR